MRCFRANSFNLIWSEGAIYIAGFEQGLKKWRPYLKQGGYIAVTEISWLTPPADAPPAIRTFWQEAYPEMATVDENVKRLTQAGYELVGQFTLPEAAWWAYYEPLRVRIATMRKKYAGNTAVLALLEEEEQEIKLYEQYAEYYSYVFYIGRVALRPDA
ncbi:MAG: hypothetical protein KDD89_08420 [Anaerolineales bacterium]|nr:hypothetical protein [Anaerolineales bacterium]